MKKENDELVSINYKIEKSGMNQQKLENRLVAISKELQRSKRNSLIFMLLFFFVIVALAGGGIYFFNESNADTIFDSDEVSSAEEIGVIQKTNDSLFGELEKLKLEIEDYQNRLTVEDSSENIIDGTGNLIDSANNQIENSSNITISNNSTLTEDEDAEKSSYIRRHCFVKKVFRSNGTIFVEVDFIEYYEGKKAVEKAKLNNAAEYDIDTSGDTLYFLYNNYYVSNTNDRLRRFELNENVVIEDLNQISNGFPLKAFQRIIENNPIMVIEMRENVIHRIRKQKLP